MAATPLMKKRIGVVIGRFQVPRLALHPGYRALLAHGKCRQKAITAVARELLGFVWALLREYRAPGTVLPREARRSVRTYTMKPRGAAATAAAAS